MRHPLYLANGPMLAGGCLLAGPPWFAIVAFETVLLWYRSVAEWEERLQRERHPHAWPRYAGAVRGWWPRLRPLRASELGEAARRDVTSDAPVYSWRQVPRRERGAIVTAVAICGLPWLRAALAGG
jgi:hypothetical protein